mgnify:CR=1 FL=1
MSEWKRIIYNLAMMLFKRQIANSLLLAVTLVATLQGAQAQQQYPPLTIEVSAEHPLFVFDMTHSGEGDVDNIGAQLVQRWGELPAELKAFSALCISIKGLSLATRHERTRGVLEFLEAAEVPVVLDVADSDPRSAYPAGLTEELLRDYVCIKGIRAHGLCFDEYSEFGPDSELNTPANVRWLISIIDAASRYGRLMILELDGLHWPRLMSNASSQPLYEKLMVCGAYVAPVARYRGGHDIPRLSTAFGLWLEGAAGQWGVGPTSAWYSDAHLLMPGVFGYGATNAAMPPALYEAMIFNGAMTGATVYVFEPEDDLWFGAARHHWKNAIYPALRELTDYALIPRKEFVEEKVRVAFQLGRCRSPLDFQHNLRDIDGVSGEGYLIWGAYGMERPGQIEELIPNSGRHYWIPILSPYASQRALQQFAEVVQPGRMASPQAWTDLLDKYYVPDGSGTASIYRVGRAVYILNNRESHRQVQDFRVPGVPAPVWKVQARRTQEGIELTWPFREYDFAYKVYRRYGPTEPFQLVAGDVEGRRWLDALPEVGQSVAYAVTALTTENEVFTGNVDFGECLALSVVESRIAEEVVVTPLADVFDSRPLPRSGALTDGIEAWWPGFEGVPNERMAVAQSIVERIERLDRAFSEKDLDGVLDLYADEYVDPENWGLQYVRRAFQWFFERYNRCSMARQIRRWDFSAYEPGQEVRVLLFCRFNGIAVSDFTGRFAGEEAYFPRTERGEVWLTFANYDGHWRIRGSQPALPNFKDILSFSGSPYEAIGPGPDRYQP